MSRIVRFFKAEALPPNPALDKAIDRAARKVAKKKSLRATATAGAS